MRAIATIAVVLLHVASNNWYGYVGTFNWNCFTIYLSLARFAVPLFVMISGVLFLNEDYKLNVKRLYRHNIFRLLVFLLFWGLAYQLYHMISAVGGFKIEMLWDAVKAVAKGETQTHLWYIYMIIGLYIICPIAKGFTENATKRQLEYFLLVSFIFNCVLTAFQGSSNKLINILTINMSKLGVTLVSGYICYFILGFYLNKYPLEKKLRALVTYGGGVMMLLTIGLTYFKSVSDNSCIEKYLGYTMPNVFIMSAAIFILIHGMKSSSKILYRVLDKIAEFSLGIYGIHMIFVFILWKIGIDTFILPGIISVPIITILVLGLSMIAVAIIKKIPYLGKWVS